jgi:hypothetical protein
MDTDRWAQCPHCQCMHARLMSVHPRRCNRCWLTLLPEKYQLGARMRLAGLPDDQSVCEVSLFYAELDLLIEEVESLS